MGGHPAAGRGHEAIVQLLIDRDDVDIDAKDKFGMTPLSQAAQRGHEAIVRLLIARGDVDINSKDISGKTPLLLAATYLLPGDYCAVAGRER